MLPGADWNLSREHRLDRVDDDERRLEARDLLEDPFERGFRQQVERSGADAESIAAALDLVLGLLARGVEHRTDLASEVRGRLQQQRRLADPRFAAEQHERPGNDAAAEHAIEFADAGRQPQRVRCFDFCVQLRDPPAPDCAYRWPPDGAGSAGRSSTSEFQAPQSAQRPIHLGA